MTTIKLYHKHKAGEVSKEAFLYEVRRDSNLPWITNVTSYDDAVKILKNKGVISEADANVATDPAVDRVNPYFLKKGVQKMLSKEKELTNDSYINALNKAAKQLASNPHAFDEDMFANAKDVEKADSKLETQEVKKNNHVDKANEMKKVKVKSLKESTVDELIGYLKKKELVNEDVHYEYHVGSEVHTPNGPGKVVEIVGSTLTVEREDGVLEDIQINTARHYTQEAQEEPPVQEPVVEPSVADMWANFKGKPFSGMVVDPEYQSDLDKKYGKVREYIAKNKHDKKKMAKLKEALKKLKEAGTQITPARGTPIFVNPSNVAEKEKELKAAGITQYTKKTVG